MTTAPPSSVASELEVLSEDQCRLLLAKAAVGRIAFVVNSLPIVLPVNYRLLNDESGLWILLRTRPGNAIDGAPEHVAFEIDGIDRDHQQGWSVLVRGVLHHLDHNEIEMFSKRFDPKPWPKQERTSWLAIKPRTVTGRRLQAGELEWGVSVRTDAPWSGLESLSRRVDSGGPGSGPFRSFLHLSCSIASSVTTFLRQLLPRHSRHT